MDSNSANSASVARRLAAVQSRARTAARQVARCTAHVGRHQPSFEQRRQCTTGAPFPELCKCRYQILVVTSRRAAKCAVCGPVPRPRAAAARYRRRR